MHTYWCISQIGAKYKSYQAVSEEQLSLAADVSAVRQWMDEHANSLSSRVKSKTILVMAHADDFAYPKPLWWTSQSSGERPIDGIFDVEVNGGFNTIFFWHDFLNYISYSRNELIEDDPNHELKRTINVGDHFRANFKRRIFTVKHNGDTHPYVDDQFTYTKHVFYRKNKVIPTTLIGPASGPWFPWALPVVLPKDSIFANQPTLDIRIAASIIKLYHYACARGSFDLNVQHIPREEWCNLIADDVYTEALHAWTKFRPDAFEFLRARHLLKTRNPVKSNKFVIQR